mgnify:CR=1 FL=1
MLRKALVLAGLSVLTLPTYAATVWTGNVVESYSSQYQFSENINISVTATGSGTAVLDSSGILTLTLDTTVIEEASDGINSPTTWSNSTYYDRTVQITGYFDTASYNFIATTGETSAGDACSSSGSSFFACKAINTSSAPLTINSGGTNGYSVSHDLFNGVKNGSGRAFYELEPSCSAWDSLECSLFPGAYVSNVPVPAAAWLFGSALIGLAGIGRRRKH